MMSTPTDLRQQYMERHSQWKHAKPTKQDVYRWPTPTYMSMLRSNNRVIVNASRGCETMRQDVTTTQSDGCQVGIASRLSCQTCHYSPRCGQTNSPTYHDPKL